MQDSSAAFDAAAVTRRAWMPPRVRTDWAADGYDGDHTIDDLSPQVSADWTVEHNLDDGYPNTVGFVSGEATPTLEASVTGRAVDGVRMTATAYWSPLRTDSPIFGYDRDIPGLTLDMGLVTANGPEYIPVFTGQMTGTPVKGGKAALTGISATRVALMRPIQPPAVTNIYSKTMLSSWVVSWCLYKCGIYAGPAPRPGTVAYYPMHGGLWRFHDGEYPGGNLIGSVVTGSESWSVIDAVPSLLVTPRGDVGWRRGPYVGAPELFLTTAMSRRAYTTQIPLGDSTWGTADLFSQTAAAGRLEMWVRGDAANVNTAPGGSATVSRLCGLQATADAVGSPAVQMGVGTDRKVYVSVFDGSNTRTLRSTGTLATDGGWYFVGAAFDAVVDKLWVNLNGTVESSSPGTMLQSQLPLTDLWEDSDLSPFLLSYLPFSDVTISTGDEANVDSFPLWRNDASFAPTATVALGTNEITAVLEKVPREAWKIIADYAQSELAAMRCDELDAFEYLPLGWWVRDEQQVVQDVLSTGRNAGTFDVELDPTRIRTSVKVTYTQVQGPSYSVQSGLFRRVFELGATASGTADLALLPGITDLRFTFTNPAMSLYRNIAADSGAFAAAESATGSATYVTLNGSPDGTGTEYAATSVPPAAITITVTAWDPGGATIRFINGTGVVLYFANNENVPVMCLTGIPAVLTQTYVQVGDDGGPRGDRLVEVQGPGIQQELTARRFAQNLLANLRLPVATIGDESSGITVTADPRRQPGDRVAIEDSETGASGDLWRLQSVRHKGQGAAYTQDVVARSVFPLAVVGQAVVGQSLVGPLPL